MPFLVPVATAIVGAIVTAAAVVAAVVAAIAAATAAVLVAVAALTAVVIVPIVSTVVGIFSWVGYTVGAYITDIASWLYTEGRAVYTTVSAWMHAVNAAVKGALEAIHFRLILEVHSIAMLVSSDYRNMMTRVYRAVSDLSKALGFGPEFMLLAIQNSRQLVLDASTTMGHKYDLAQVQWLSSFSDFLTHVNIYASTYANNPEQLFYDLQQLIDKPAMDAKGSFTQIFLGAVEAVVDTTEKLVGEVSRINTDLERLVSDLPGFIREHVEPFITPITSAIENTINTDLRPRLNSLQGMIDQYNIARQKIESDVSGIAERLKKPHKYLKEIDSLSPEEKKEAELTIYDLSVRAMTPWVAGMTEYSGTTHQEFEAQIRTPLPTTQPPAWETYEPASIPEKTMGLLVPRVTWFVGDF